MEITNPAAEEEARHRALADPTRRRILRILADLPEPAGVQDLASHLGLHPNTVRGHLDVLEEAELVECSVEERATPGRPRLLYKPAPESEPSLGGYRLLAEMLTTSLELSAEDPSRAAHEAGRAWGRRVTPPSERSLTHREVAERVTTMLADLGFEPDAERGDSSTTIELNDCPFRDLAQTQPNVVCSLHLGLIEGAVESLGSPDSVESLEPFVAPSRCRAVLRS